jgi:hypothetical protein
MKNSTSDHDSYYHSNKYYPEYYYPSQSLSTPKSNKKNRTVYYGGQASDQISSLTEFITQSTSENPLALRRALDGVLETVSSNYEIQKEALKIVYSNGDELLRWIEDFLNNNPDVDEQLIRETFKNAPELDIIVERFKTHQQNENLKKKVDNLLASKGIKKNDNVNIASTNNKKMNNVKKNNANKMTQNLKNNKKTNQGSEGFFESIFPF